MSKKCQIKIFVEDDSVAVQCDGGAITYNKINNPWLWLLNAVAFPAEYDVEIKDYRKNRQTHQRDLTTAKAGETE